jgi:hypothetical protein
LEIFHRCATLIVSEIWALRKVDQKYLENSETWSWRRMGKISWMDRVRNEEVITYSEEENKYPTYEYNTKKEC